MYLITEFGEHIPVEDINFSSGLASGTNPYRYVHGPKGGYTVHLFKKSGEDFPVATIGEERGYASTLIEVLREFLRHGVESDVRAVDVRDRLREVVSEAGFPPYPERDFDDGWRPTYHRLFIKERNNTIGLQPGQFALLSYEAGSYDTTLTHEGTFATRDAALEAYEAAKRDPAYDARGFQLVTLGPLGVLRGCWDGNLTVRPPILSKR